MAVAKKSTAKSTVSSSDTTSVTVKPASGNVTYSVKVVGKCTLNPARKRAIGQVDAQSRLIAARRQGSGLC